jgi:hypothetical protein
MIEHVAWEGVLELVGALMVGNQAACWGVGLVLEMLRVVACRIVLVVACRIVDGRRRMKAWRHS